MTVTKLLVLCLIGFVRGNPGSLRAPIFEADSFRELQSAGNETEAEDPSDLIGGGDGEENPSKNETEPSETVTTEAPTPVATEAPPAATDAPADLGTNTTSEESTPPPTEETPAKTESPGPDDATPTPTNTETAVPTDADDEFGEEDDDEFGNDDYGEGEVEGEGEEWGFEPEEQRTKTPYVPPTGDDPFAKEPDESEWANQDWKQETPEEMMHDKNVIIAVASAVLFGFVLAICSAQQVIENPDGCCAGMCRCAVKFFCFFFKIICFPCRMCCGSKDRRTHDLMIGTSDSYTHDLELT